MADHKVMADGGARGVAGVVAGRKVSVVSVSVGVAGNC